MKNTLSKSLLSADIGNSAISCALFRGSMLIKRFDIPTRSGTAGLGAFLRRNTRAYPVGSAIIASVVPSVVAPLKKALLSLTGSAPLVLGEDFRVPIRNRYRKPASVGQDRLVNAYAALRLYKAPAIIVDAGTALTFDVVSRRKDYLGGMIIPGFEVSLRALFERTALLPKVRLQETRAFIGRDTKNSILSGLLWGYSLLTESLVEKIKKEIGREAVVIGTGGCIDFIARRTKAFDHVDRSFTLKGLNLLHRIYLTGALDKV
ncbi:MAG: type III pantothenate kinase [Candidatus Omnitrophica bacterium]|nr:type III pantothenate kinase [Candidatus Omnitrophota bacterium]